MSKLQSNPANKRRRIANVLIVAGLALVGVWAWWSLRGVIYQHRQNNIFERRKTTILPPAPVPAPRVRNGDVLGRLVVPRLHLSAMVREGAGQDMLGVALGHIPGTAFPGQSGNVAVAGHRDTLFRPLRNIREDDLIEFQTLRGDYQYRVVSTQIVSPLDVRVLQASQSPEITLVTCYPFYYVGHAPNRFIVKARLVTSPATPTVQKAAVVQTVSTPDPPPASAQHKMEPPPAKLTGPRRIPFLVSENHSRELAPGISIGLTWTDPARRTVNGWMWLMPDRRTIWLRDQPLGQPIVFYGYADGRERRLVITKVTPNSIAGYLTVPENNTSATY